MRRHHSLLFLTLFCVASAPLYARQQAAPPPSVDEIVTRNLTAKGGADRMRAVHSTRITATATLNGVEAPMVMEAKKPNLMRQEVTVQGNTIVQGFDGNSAWVLNPAMNPQPIQLPAQQSAAMKSQADFDSPLLDYKTKGTKVELAGVEDIDGRKAYHLKVTPASAASRDYYIDAETGLEFRVDSAVQQNGQSNTLVVQMSDYRDVDGLKMPFDLKQTVDGRTIGELKISKIELNVPLEDTRFKVPTGR